MKKALLCLALAPCLGCHSGIANRGDHHRNWRHSKPDPVTAKSPAPFEPDDGTIFLSDFDGNTLDRVGGASGGNGGGTFSAALFGSGVHPSPGAAGKYLIRYPNSRALSSLETGTLEALVRCDSAQPGFSHIVEKAWQYALSAHEGKLAACFGTQWWYSEAKLPVGEWSYVAATFDGDTLRIYLNGALAGAAAYAGDRSSEYSTGFDLAIGNSSSDEFDIPFRGTVDAVRISVRVRDAHAIAGVWQAIAKQP